MPVFLLTLFLVIITSIVGVNHVDTALASSHQTWLQDQMDMALHHAAIVPVDDGLNEGIKEIKFDEALERLADRLHENADLEYDQRNSVLQPGDGSVIKSDIGLKVDFISLENSKSSWLLVYQFRDGKLEEISRTEKGTGGLLDVEILTQDGRRLSLPPKQLHGPTLVAVAYTEEPRMNSYTGLTRIPVISIQGIYN